MLHHCSAELGEVLVAVMSNSFRPHGLGLAWLFCPWDSPAKDFRSGLPVPSPDLPDPGIELRSSVLQAEGGFTV